MPGRREEYLSWDEYFMGLAILSANRSKDPSTQTGACIVNDEKRIVSVGYNGAPRGIEDYSFPWDSKGEQTGDLLTTKNLWVVHAELNAILNSRVSELKNTTMYVTFFPCNECAKAIIQAGIKTVVYDSDKYADTASTKASKRMFDAAGVRYYQYQRSGRNIQITI